jgi:hypothetical protein
MGGMFTKINDGSLTGLGGIVRYDTVARSWNALPKKGLNSEVMALTAVGNDLYVAGNFTQTGDGTVMNLGNIARFDTTAGTWNAMPKKGLNAEIYALAVIGSDLFVGGRFTQTGDGALANLGGIARYDTVAGTWNALPHEGLSSYVYVLATSGSNLYVGGNFSQTGDGTVINLNGLARYDTAVGTWNSLPNQGLKGSVTALTVSGGDLYAGGIFSQTYDGSLLNLGNIAHLSVMTGTWDALPNKGLDNQVLVLILVGNDLYAGGIFKQTGDGLIKNLSYIARYNMVTGAWNALPNHGLNDWVYDINEYNSSLYVGGNFSQTGDGSIIDLNRIARLGFYENLQYLPMVNNR